MKKFRHKLHIALAVLIVLVLVLGSFQTGQAQDAEQAPATSNEAPPAELPAENEQAQDVVVPATDQGGAKKPPPAERPPEDEEPQPVDLPAPDPVDAEGEPPPQDVAPPTFEQSQSVVVPATDRDGAAVTYAVPRAFDDRDGQVAVGCEPPPGSFFGVGDTRVHCWAQDIAGNDANTELWVSVLPYPTPVPTEPPPTPTQPPPTATEPPTTPTATVPAPTASPPAPTAQATGQAPSPTPPGTSPVVSTEEPDGSEVSPTASAEATSTPTTPEGETPGTEPSTRTPSPIATLVPVPGPVGMPWPPPPGFIRVTGSGPVGDLSLIWGYRNFRISQEYGHTAFSVKMPHWYAYGRNYGLDGFAHPGLDISMPAGTPLYSPVNGTVTIAGGTRGFTHYGNGSPGVGQLTIRTAEGHEVILGHMGNIVVERGQRVVVGQFVGLSGGMNGDHLHLETRELQPGGGYRVIDPRNSFLLMHLGGEAELQGGCTDQDGLGQRAAAFCTDECAIGDGSSLANTDCARLTSVGQEMSIPGISTPQISFGLDDDPQLTGACAVGGEPPSGEPTLTAEPILVSGGTDPILVSGGTEPAVNVVSASDWLGGASDDATTTPVPDTLTTGTQPALAFEPASNAADPFSTPTIDCGNAGLILSMPVTGSKAAAIANRTTQAVLLLIGASGCVLGAAIAIRQYGGGPRRRTLQESKEPAGPKG